MTEIERIEELVETWRAKWLMDEDTQPELICRDDPQLLPEVRRRIAELKLLEELVVRYEELRDAGKNPQPEVVCKDHPELLDAFNAEIEDLHRFDSVFGDEDEGPSPPELTVGQFCDGRYSVEGIINRGGQGVIYSARDRELGRTVVVKGPGRRGLGREALSRLEQEAHTTGRLEHPGVVPVYGFGRDQKGKPYYAMKFIDGETLSAVIKHFHQNAAENLPGARALEFQKLLRDFVQVCQTIAFAHSRGVVHRDIKPMNIMLGKFGEVWVVDWGLAKRPADKSALRADDEPIFDDAASQAASPIFETDSNWNNPWHSQTYSIKGTVAYMSPEQAAGRNREVGPASDIYSLGATLFELLTGRPPVASQSQPRRVLSPREINGRVPPSLSAIYLFESA